MVIRGGGKKRAGDNQTVPSGGRVRRRGGAGIIKDVVKKGG